MTSFVHTHYPDEHPALMRVQKLNSAWANFRAGFDASKSLAAMLLAAVAAALVVIADRLIDTWADGHLLVAWVALWAVAFAALGLLAPVVKRSISAGTQSFNAWSARSAQRHSEALYWESAQRDPRIMVELQAAINRAEEAGVVNAAEMVPAALRFDPSEPSAALERLHAMMPPGKKYLMYI